MVEQERQASCQVLSTYHQAVEEAVKDVQATWLLALEKVQEAVSVLIMHHTQVLAK
jgi:hypothetical protein